MREGAPQRPAVVVVVPARYGSTRLPAKALLAETGRALVVHVWERARRARSVDRVVVATDDARIADVVRAAGGEAVLTRADHPTGSDRVGEVLPRLTADVVVNVQGDEPEIEPALIDRLVERLAEDPEIGVATAAAPITDRARLADPNVVKVVRDAAGRALYFSRSPLPGRRSDGPDPWSVGATPLQHVGVYAYRRSALEIFLRLPPSPLETAESLEQLRLAEHGVRYGVVVVDAAPRGIDTAEDYAAFVARERGRRVG